MFSMIQPSLMAMFLPIVLGGIGGLNGGDFRGNNWRIPSPNTMSSNIGSSGNSNLMSGNIPLTETPPPPKEIFPPRVPYTCTLFVDSGYFCPSRYPRRPSTQYYYDPYTQRCQTFYYRGCGGTPNRFSSRNECLRGCGCFSDIDFGNSCPYTPYNFFQQYTIRYAFNQYTGTCRSFRYSACNGGNDNNFRSQLECQSTCGPSSGDLDAPPFPGRNFAASSNSMQQDTARAINMRFPEAGSSSNIRSSSQMPTEGNVPLNTGSQINFGSSSIMAMERSPSDINSGVLGFPAIQNNFGSSALSAGNSAMNGRLNQMPSPLNPGTAQVMNLNGQIFPAVGNGMQNRMISRKGNKIY